jgi:hypothetical protein
MEILLSAEMSADVLKMSADPVFRMVWRPFLLERPCRTLPKIETGCSVET